MATAPDLACRPALSFRPVSAFVDLLCRLCASEQMPACRALAARSPANR
jgi:hypothetical protein